MFGISMLRKHFSKTSKSRQPSRRTAVQLCPDLLEGRELMAPLGGRFFAHRLQQAALSGAGPRGLQANVSAISPTPGARLGRVVRNPALISPVDPYGQYQTFRAALPSPRNPFGGASAPVRNPALISPVDPYGQYQTMKAVPPTSETPRGGPSTPVHDSSLISPVDPYGEYVLN